MGRKSPNLWGMVFSRLTVIDKTWDGNGAIRWKYAPSSENDTSEYLKFVCDGLGLTPDTPMSKALKMEVI